MWPIHTDGMMDFRGLQEVFFFFFRILHAFICFFVGGNQRIRSNKSIFSWNNKSNSPRFGLNLQISNLPRDCELELSLCARTLAGERMPLECKRDPASAITAMSWPAPSVTCGPYDAASKGSNALVLLIKEPYVVSLATATGPNFTLE